MPCIAGRERMSTARSLYASLNDDDNINTLDDLPEGCWAGFGLTPAGEAGGGLEVIVAGEGGPSEDDGDGLSAVGDWAEEGEGLKS